MIHLDTNFLIGALVPGSRESATLVNWLRRNENVAVSAVVWTEFLCGPVTAEHIDTAAEIFGEPVPFDANAAIAAASLFNSGKRRRGSLADCMIAGAALVAGARIATNNRADFERFQEQGLVLERA
ncbi:MAG: type II toxin-antitoxin system VapC family toxin [Gemmatimonadaceae bacterium]